MFWDVIFLLTVTGGDLSCRTHSRLYKPDDIITVNKGFWSNAGTSFSIWFFVSAFFLFFSFLFFFLFSWPLLCPISLFFVVEGNVHWFHWEYSSQDFEGLGLLSTLQREQLMWKLSGFSFVWESTIKGFNFWGFGEEI